MATSEIKRALPVFMLVYFLSMSATMSVPPEVALQLNIIALPTPVRSMA